MPCAHSASQDCVACSPSQANNTTDPSAWRVIYLPREDCQGLTEATTVRELKGLLVKHYRSGHGRVYDALCASVLGGEAAHFDYGLGQCRARERKVSEETIGIGTSAGAAAGKLLSEEETLGDIEAEASTATATATGPNAAGERPYDDQHKTVVLHLHFRGPWPTAATATAGAPKSPAEVQAEGHS